MKDFAVIDFETANTERSSLCSVDILVYRDGRKVDDFYSLINPCVEETLCDVAT